jgi:hypothetical protein
VHTKGLKKVLQKYNYYISPERATSKLHNPVKSLKNFQEHRVVTPKVGTPQMVKVKSDLSQKRSIIWQWQNNFQKYCNRVKVLLFPYTRILRSFTFCDLLYLLKPILSLGMHSKRYAMILLLILFSPRMAHATRMSLILHAGGCRLKSSAFSLHI